MNTFKKSLLLLLGLTMSATLLAQQFYNEGIIYEVLMEQPSAVRVYKVNRCMKSFQIPDKVTDYSNVEYDVTRIGSEGFRSACSLIDLHLGQVEIIEDGYMNYYEDGAADCHGGFFGCTDLSSVMMPRITEIGDYAFYKCPKLSKLTLGARLQRIGKEAFVNCPSLGLIQLDAAQPPVCASDAFMDEIYNQTVLRVPYGRKSLYEQADVWKRFLHIEEMSESTGLSFVTDDAKRIQVRAMTDVISIGGLHPGETVCLYSFDGRLLNKRVAVEENMQMKIEDGRNYIINVGMLTLKIRK